MAIFRRIGLGFSALLLVICLAAFALLVGLYAVLSTAQPLKEALYNSHAYEEITPNVLAQQDAALSLPVSDPGMRKALTQALSEEFYQNSSEKIIDSTYEWMHGNTDTLEFSIDAATVRDNFANNIATYVRQRLGALPACEKIIAPPASVDEVLSLTCMPLYVTPASIADTARREALKARLLPGGDTLTATTLQDEKGRPLAEQLAFLPPLYHAYTISLVALPLLILLFVFGIVFLSPTKRTGVRRVAWSMLGVGVSGMVLATASTGLFYMAARVFGLPLPAPFGLYTEAVSITEALIADVRPWWFGVSAACAVLAVALFIVLWLTRPKHRLKFSDEEGPQYEEVT